LADAVEENMNPTIGQMVRLKSNGKVVTVKAIETDEQGRTLVTCSWLTMAMEEETQVYPLEALIPAERPKRAVANAGGYTVESNS
jgi:hypothetical protein